ncbi:MAG: hypothetical protein NVSMB3_06400 [Acidobacteriaceae bacterium]
MNLARLGVVSDRIVLPLRLLLGAALVGGLLYYIAVSIHWPIVWDAAVMHYISLLMDHGMKPYQDITDSNMPGTYITERLAMHLFGGGDLAWRLYDLFLCGALTLATTVIARPYDWLAGVYAGLFFTLFHGSDGPRFTGERDLVMTVLLVCALAFLLTALRRLHPVWMLPFALASGMAASIKPTSAPLAILLFVAALLLVRRRDRNLVLPLIGWTAAGYALTAAIVFGFLFRYHALHPLLFVVRDLLPSYVSLRQLGVAELLRSILPHSVILILALTVLLALWNRGWNAERWLILVGVVFGAVSYFAQRKGFPYHRYPLLAFLFLFMGIEILLGLRRRGISRAVAAAALVLFTFLSEPHLLHSMRPQSATFPINFSERLSSDLRPLGVDRLQGQVECYDLTYGCFSALYHLGVVQPNGITGDLLFFSPTSTPAVDYYRKLFWRLDAKRPASVLVITNQWFQESNSFEKLKAWPAFDEYLQAQYVLVLSRSFPVSDAPPGPADPPQPAYRIYVRKGTPLLREAILQMHAADPASSPAR